METNGAATEASGSRAQLERALEDYLAAAEAGVAPPRDEFLAHFPQLARELEQCLASLEFLRKAAKGANSVGEVVEAAAQDGAIPASIGEYRILREVGRGGMGIVYEAEQTSLGRRVALKVLPFAAVLDPRQLQRFQNEARAAACLQHPNIVPIYAVGCDRGVHYFAMKLIDGQSLEALIREMRGEGRPSASGPAGGGAAEATTLVAAETRSLPQTASSSCLNAAHFRRAAELARQAAETLDHAHQLGVIHRDIKPGNLLLDGDGKLWVTDFGLARMQTDLSLSATGDVLGTLRYMSPEQALGRRSGVDQRTDVYSLGATLYELLLLQPIFANAQREDLFRCIADEEPCPPRRLNGALPHDLEVIVLKALAKDREKRYGSAREMADDLGRFLNQEPVQARAPRLGQRVAAWCTRPEWLANAAWLMMLVNGLVAPAIWIVLIATAFARLPVADRVAGWGFGLANLGLVYVPMCWLGWQVLRRHRRAALWGGLAIALFDFARATALVAVDWDAGGAALSVPAAILLGLIQLEIAAIVLALCASYSMGLVRQDDSA